MANKDIMVCIWMDNEAQEAAQLYVDTFKNAKIDQTTHYTTETPSNKPIGSILTIDMTIRDQKVQLLNGGKEFKANPSISFFVSFDTTNTDSNLPGIDEAWEKLVEGGKVLMPLEEYPFSKRYGWLEDKYGVSWQLIVTEPDGNENPGIFPSLSGSIPAGYLEIVPRLESLKTDKEGTVMYMDFKLLGTWFAAMDSAHQHNFDFSEGVSFVVECDDQAEIDYYWDKLSSIPEAEQCGWCKDKYGVSWQIVPKMLNDALFKSDDDKAKRAMDAMLEMKKINIAEIEAAME